MFMYLDDGAGAAPTYNEALHLSTLVRNDIIDAGFLLSEKSRFKPSQSGRFRPEVIDNFCPCSL